VDSTNHVLYEFYGYNAAGTNAEVAQVVYYNNNGGTPTVEFVGSGTAGIPGLASSTAGTNLADLLTTSPNDYYITKGAFSQSYFSGFSDTSSFLYACGTNALNTGSNAVGVSLQQFSFNSSMQLQPTPIKVALLDNTLTASGIAASDHAICSPITEFDNSGTDRLFLNVQALASSSLMSFDITSNNNTTGPSYGITGPTKATTSGSSGIIVDGADPTTNASSLYLTGLASTNGLTCTTSGTNGNQANPANIGIGSINPAICAFKLTQGGLQ
jgi:hypothetical protein